MDGRFHAWGVRGAPAGIIRLSFKWTTEFYELGESLKMKVVILAGGFRHTPGRRN